MLRLHFHIGSIFAKRTTVRCLRSGTFSGYAAAPGNWKMVIKTIHVMDIDMDEFF
jgi:hypothetical protein